MKQGEYSKILKVIEAANSGLQLDNLRYSVLEELQEALEADSLIFFLADSGEALHDPLMKDTDPTNAKLYLDYYFRLDPMNPRNLPASDIKAFRYDQVVHYADFTRTEYYNDFLVPQCVHFGLFIYLRSMGRLEGRISLFRPRHQKNFSAQELLLARELSPYLASSVQNAKLFKRLEEENIFRRIDDEHSSKGYLLLDDRLEQLFVSKGIAELIDSLKRKGIVEDTNLVLPKEVMGDCLELRNHVYETVLPLPKNRVVRISTDDYLVFHSQVIHRDFWTKCPARIMVIFEKFHTGGIDQKSLQEAYGLTKREREIVAMVALVLRNAQIASRLFVSEVTVKKHIQNIFDKMAVNNRTEMVNKLHPTSMKDCTEASHIPPVNS